MYLSNWQLIFEGTQSPINEKFNLDEVIKKSLDYNPK
jgi:hypothetical protein